jgi:hypothetical protein
MPKPVIFKGTKVSFPNACVVCLQPATKEYKVMRTLNYGNRNITVTFPVPMCEKHHELAVKTNAAEKRVGKIGTVLGLVLGVLAVAGLLIYWSTSGTGLNAGNIILALIVGAGFFLILWTLFAGFIAPKYADEDTKTARNAIKIGRFWPAKQELELIFYNDQIANAIAQVNKDIIAG